MKQHPDRQPRRAVAVHRRDDDDGNADQDFEGGWIDNLSPRDYATICVTSNEPAVAGASM
jgi:hypothetical protein